MNTEASDTAWIAALQGCIASATPAVLVTVAGAKGSVPREPGAKMVVTARALLGTIGGGHLEWKATEIARRLLSGEAIEPLHRFALGASLGQCCGGLAQLLFEPVAAPARWLDSVSRESRRAPDPAFVVVTPVRAAATADKLIVGAATSEGSFDGGDFDAAAIAAARALLAGQGPARLVEIEAAGTRLECLLDPVRTCDWRIVLFGAGHVGQAVVRALAELPCRITWVDSRDAVFPGQVPDNTTVVATDVPEAEVAAAPPGAYFLVMTHSHPLDQALTEQVLRRSDFAYFGLIGSAAKRRQFERRLLARGVDAARLATMTCPIGIAGIEDKRPATIAIAVAAEVVLRYEAARRGDRQGQPMADAGARTGPRAGSARN